MKTVFVSGSFNASPRASKAYKIAKSHGDKLVVGVLSDKVAGKAAHVSEKLRLDSLKNNKLVDEVILIKDHWLKQF